MSHLLSIDDDRSVHHLVKQTFKDIGIEVSTALSASEANRPAQRGGCHDVRLDAIGCKINGGRQGRVTKGIELANSDKEHDNRAHDQAGQGDVVQQSSQHAPQQRIGQWLS